MSAATPQRFPDPGTAWESNRRWEEKLAFDALRIKAFLPAELRPLHRAVASRARKADASALVLTGSTARGRRTEISDLDYHCVGPSFDVEDLSRELDLHFLTAGGLHERIEQGDDFIQWSLRFGLVVFDRGALREASETIATERPWPDVSRKRAHAEKSLALARRFVEAEDQDGAVEQVRTALSLSARAYLLSAGVFPLSRAELPSQLRASGQAAAGDALEATILGWPSLTELQATCTRTDALLRDSVRVIQLPAKRV
jgi:hypothetical protein